MNNKELYIWHHTGLGDHYICGGLVRHFASLYDKIILFYKNPNKANVKYLYKDLDNIEFKDAGVHEDHLAKGFILLNPFANLLQIGFNYLNNTKLDFDAAFYEQAGLPLEYKWSKFHLERDLAKEKHVFYNILGLKTDEKYIFVHDHPKFETKQIPDNIKIIKPDNMNVPIHDYLYTIEQAKEVHLMNSSLLCLTDAIQIKHDNLFYHEYIRNINMKLKLNWNIIR
jgi:hypothetical protein